MLQVRMKTRPSSTQTTDCQKGYLDKTEVNKETPIFKSP